MTDKQMIIDSGQKWLDAFDSEVLYVSRETVKLVLKVLKEEPQIVRCKDCKHNTIINDALYCDRSDELWMRLRKPDWYCADGEKSHD